MNIAQLEAIISSYGSKYTNTTVDPDRAKKEQLLKLLQLKKIRGIKSISKSN